MKKIYLSLIFLLIAAYSYSQIIVNSAVTTPSTCYNDGTLTLNVSGGVAPYQYSIINGPVLPNITYPISPDHGSTFVSLHWGTYTVLITDNAGNTLQHSVTISGNYEFPTLSSSVTLNRINVTPSQGLPPYTYSISTTGPNGPFSSTRTTGVFDSLCNGTYFVRVQDSCGNFYTTPGILINQPPLSASAICSASGSGDVVNVFANNTGNPPYRYAIRNGSFFATNNTGVFTLPTSAVCPDTVWVFDYCGDTAISFVDCHPLNAGNFCSNFTNGSATATASGGTLPYTYTLTFSDTSYTITQTNGNFTQIPYLNDTTTSITITITDDCGRSVAFSDRYLDLSAFTNCPYDSNLYVNVTGAIGNSVVTCISCVPQQIASGNPPHFSGLDTGDYTIRVVDDCGETREFVKHAPQNQPISATVKYTACNDAQITTISTTGQPITSGVEFVLYIGTDSIVNTTGIFENLPQGAYTVRVTPDQCIGTTVNVYIPFFSGYCYTPYFDSLCQLKLIVRYGDAQSDLPETYSLVRNGVSIPETPVGGGNGVFFNITPGSYTLVSDSGCQVNQNFNFNFDLTESHSTSCLNAGSDTLRPVNSAFTTCSGLNLRYSLENSDTVYALNTTFSPQVVFNNLPADTYVARVQFNYDSVPFGNTYVRNNRNCVLDSLDVILPSHTVPFLTSSNVTVCGATDVADIPFTITGGFPPYLISIPGHGSITTSSQSSVLPNIPIGSYTMIVSDACGISSSFSVGVVDSCVSCDTISSNYSVSGINVCTEDTVFFQNNGSHFVTYEWRINDSIFSIAENPALVVNEQGTHTIVCYMKLFLCLDTFRTTINVTQTPNFNLGNDTLICDDISHTLSTGFASAQWSTGVTSASIVVTAPGTYSATVTNQCGTHSDTITITQSFSPVIDLGNDTVLCAGENVVLDAFYPNTTYLWSNGSTASSIVVTQGGTYSVIASSGGCFTYDTIALEDVTINENLLIADTVLCIGRTITLTPATGNNPVWQDGTHAPSYSVSDSGLYTVLVQTVCGEYSDSAYIGFELCESRIRAPEAFTPNGDGLNDFFTVFGTSIADYEIRIFNRWGELVYQSNNADELNNLSKGWDGTHKGKLQTTATFVYYITAKGFDGQTFFEKGNVTLIR